MRIREIANLINNAKIVVDVGSDHANLSTILISEKRSEIVYNIEKNEKPYLNSVKNTKKYPNQIINILSDGFAKFDQSILIDYCVIAGMGASLMVDILCKTINKISNIILCPNNNEHLIRLFAYNNFYRIKKDIIIKENNIFYPLIWLSKTEGIKSSRRKKNLICGMKKLKKEDLLYSEYLASKIKSLSTIDNLEINNYLKFQELKIFEKEFNRINKKK